MSMFSGGELSRMPLGWVMWTLIVLAGIGVVAIIAMGGWAFFAFIISHLRWV